MASSLQPAAVLATLPVDLRKAFEDSDEVLMKAALSNLSGELKKYHWSRIQASGLWSPGMQWTRPLPTSMVAQPVSKHISVTFHGPLGLTLDTDRLDIAIVRQLDTGSAAKTHGVTVGATIVSVNGKSAAGMKRDQVIALVQDAAFPKNIAFALPTTTPSGAATAVASPKRTLDSHLTIDAKHPPTVVVTPDRKELCVTFRVRPLGIHISDTMLDRAVIKALDASSPASVSGVPLGATIASLNGKSTAGMSRDAVVANIKRAPFPKTITFTPPDNDTPGPTAARKPPLETAPKPPEAASSPPEATPKPPEAAPSPTEAAPSPLEAAPNAPEVAPDPAAPQPEPEPASERSVPAMESATASIPAVDPILTAELAALPLPSPARVVQLSRPSNIEADATTESRPEGAVAGPPRQSPAVESEAPSKPPPIKTSSELAVLPPYSPPSSNATAQKQAPSPGQGRGGVWLTIILLAICIVALFDAGLKIVRGGGIPSLLSPSPPPACHWQGLQGCVPSNRFTSSCGFLFSLNGNVCHGAN